MSGCVMILYYMFQPSRISYRSWCIQRGIGIKKRQIEIIGEGGGDVGVTGKHAYKATPLAR